ncbi:MAG: ABC transporter permease [Firmicutes bacterium]|jgi:putative ABC transport system permease protein|nr:ABC transporter permease [Bacillota bacterium]
MGILLKFTFKNIKESKFRSFLIIISVALSVALFFGSFSLSDTVENMFVEQFKAYFGTAEEIVQPDKSSTFRYMVPENLELDYEYLVGAYETSGQFKAKDGTKTGVSIKGFELDGLDKMNPITILEKGKLDDFSGKKVIVGKKFADENGYKLGDDIVFEIGGKKDKYFIEGIAEDYGFFRPNDYNKTVIVPRNTLATKYGKAGHVTSIYVKPKEMLDFDTVEKDLKKGYNKHMIQETISKKEINEISKQIRTPFLFMLISVIFISIYIIYTSFKVITLERLPILGTFRSVGATKKMTNRVLIIESMTYGIIGGIVGSGLGILVLKGVTKVLGSGALTGQPMRVAMKFNPMNILYGFLLAVILSFISAIIPIRKTSKMPIKEILLNIMEGNKKKKTYIRYIIGAFLMVAANVLPNIVPEAQKLMVCAISMVMISVAIVMLVPVMTMFLLRFVTPIISKLFGNIGILVGKGFKGNKGLISSIILLTMGISSLMMIDSLSSSVNSLITEHYDNMHYDVSLRIWGSKEGGGIGNTLYQKIASVDNVKGYLPYDSTWGVSLANKKDFADEVAAIKNMEYFKYFGLEIETDDLDGLVKKLNNSRSMVLSKNMMNTSGYKIGDKFLLKTPSGNRNYEIIAFTRKSSGNDKKMYIGDVFLRSDFRTGKPGNIAIKLKDPSQFFSTKGEIETKLNNYWYRLSSVEEDKARNLKSNATMLMLMKAFSIVTMVIGTIGIVNNFLVDFMRRRRSLALYASVGMSRRQTVKMVFAEALTTGFFGGIFGIFGTILMVRMLTMIFKALEMGLDIAVQPSLMIQMTIGSMILSLISSIVPAMKSSRINIVNEIKYE